MTTLAVDPSSAEAEVEDRFFREGLEDLTEPAASSLRSLSCPYWLSRRLVAGGGAALALFLSGLVLFSVTDPTDGPKVVRPAVAARVAVPTSPPALETPRLRPPAPAEKPPVLAPTDPMLPQRCREACARGSHGDVLAACPVAFEADPAAASDPTLAEAYVYLGSTEQLAGRTQAARAAYLKYLELAPRGRHARDLRVILQSF